MFPYSFIRLLFLCKKASILNFINVTQSDNDNDIHTKTQGVSHMLHHKMSDKIKLPTEKEAYNIQRIISMPKVLVVFVTYCGPYIMASVPRYPLVKPRRDSATTVAASLRINVGSCRSDTAMFDNRITGTKTSRSRDSNIRSTRLDFLGYT